jgi:mechanosensitive ion channel-like protein
VVIAAVNIGDSVERGFDTFFAWLPALIGALVILVIGYFVAKIVGNLLARVLARAGLDRTMLTGQTGEWVRKVTTSPSVLAGKLAFWAIFLGAISLAATALGIEALTAFVASVYAYLPNVIAAVLIFLVAGAIAAGVSTLASRFMGDTPTGRVVSTAAPILVMTIATFMILDQLKIAEDIVVITYAALVGSIALGAALAFGLGGRDIAAQMLRGAYVRGQAATEQAKRDIELGRQRVETKTAVGSEAKQPTVIAAQPEQPATPRRP